LYYVNEESDEVIGGSTRAVQHSVGSGSGNVGAVFFRLGTGNVHHKRESITPTVVVMATLSAPVSFCKKPNMHMTEGLDQHTIGSHIALTIPSRLL